MGRHSSLDIPSNLYFLKLCPAITELFGGDVCCSGIISIIDFLTMGKLNEFEAISESEGLLWVRISLDQIYYQLNGMYAIRRIQDRLRFLNAEEFVQVPSDQSLFGRKSSTALAFLLNRQKISDVYRSGLTVPYREIAAGEEEKMPTIVGATTPVCLPTKRGENVAVCQQNEGALNLKEVKEEEETEKPPYSPPTFEAEDQNPTHHGGVIDRDTGEYREERKFSKPFRAGRRGGRGKNDTDPNSTSACLKRFQEAAAARSASATVAQVASPGPPSGSKTPESSQQPKNPASVDFPARWNELIPERPVDAALLARHPKAYDHPIWIERFEDICRKAKKLIADGATDILQFGFLLKVDPKNDNQYRFQQLLLNGMSWVIPRTDGNGSSGGKPKPPDGKAMARKREEEKLRKQQEEAERENQAKGTDQEAG